MSSSTSASIAGSSPLTRGKLSDASRVASGTGLIPAHAGKTGPPSLCPTTPRAHPRSRGENGRHSMPIVRMLGSSPLTRGKQLGNRGRGQGLRLIPAHAGKTRRPGRTRWRRPAHPRSRGENAWLNSWAVISPGSSPLTQGKRAARSSRSGRWGLIPAHAGKTPRTRRGCSATWAHPRSRGENAVFLMPDVYTVGSSPLTRGKLDKVRGHQGHGGLIPAHAGKTRIATSVWSLSTAHPRSRGENKHIRPQLA